MRPLRTQLRPRTFTPCGLRASLTASPNTCPSSASTALTSAFRANTASSLRHRSLFTYGLAAAMLAAPAAVDAQSAVPQTPSELVGSTWDARRIIEGPTCPCSFWVWWEFLANGQFRYHRENVTIWDVGTWSASGQVVRLNYPSMRFIDSDDSHSDAQWDELVLSGGVLRGHGASAEYRWQYDEDPGFVKMLSWNRPADGRQSRRADTRVDQPQQSSRGTALPGDRVREIEFKTRAERAEEARVRAADERLRQEAERAPQEEARRLEEQARNQAMAQARADAESRESLRRARANFAADRILDALPSDQAQGAGKSWTDLSNGPRDILDSWLENTATRTAMRQTLGTLPTGPVQRAVNTVVESILPKADPLDPLSVNTLVRNFVASVSKSAFTSWLYEQSVVAGAAKTGDPATDQAERILSAAGLRNLAGFGLKKYMEGVGAEGSKLPTAISQMFARELP
jgi:hypothetical protein